MGARTASMRVGAAAALCLALAGVSPAAAQSTIGQAEEAYMNVDFERTRELCQQALREGGHSPEQLARIYELIGVASAASGEEGASREAYKKMLAIQPDAQVDTNLAPRLRSPFMEARGYWQTRSETMGAEAVLVRARGGLRVRITDPLGMAEEVRVLTRVAGELVPMDEERFPAQESILVEVDGLPDADRIEYVVQVLDEHGNRLVDLGSEDEPNVVGRDPVIAGGTPGGGGGGEDEDDGVPGWVWGVVGVVVVAAGAGVGLGLALRDKPVNLQGGITFD